MFTLDQIECRSITAPLSLSLFLASQATSFSHLRFPHHRHHHHHNSSRKPVLAPPLRSTVHFSTPSRFTHPSLKLTHTPLKLTHINKLKVSACSHDSIPLADSLISAATYSSPLLDGLGYGFSRVLPYQYPQIFLLYHSNPLPRYLVFVAIFIFVIQNPKFSKYVRLNAVQAILLGELLKLPGLGFRTIISPVWPQLTMICCDFMFFVTVFGFVYSMVKIILRETPEFPLVTDAAAIHLRLL